MRTEAGGASVRFDPAGALVRPGTTIRWILDSGVHTTTSYHPDNGRPLRMPAGAPGWDSGHLMDAGAAFQVTLREEGVYDYFCRPHEAAGMVGRIVVFSGRPDPSALPEPAYPERSADGALPAAAAGGFPRVEAILRRGSADRETNARDS